MTVITFPSPATAPAFRTMPEALRWHEARRTRPTTAPPVDAVGEPTADMYLATIFAGLLEMPTVGARVAHLHEKATEQDRHRARLDLEGHSGSTAHARVRDTLRKWARELQEASAEAAFEGGGAA